MDDAPVPIMPLTNMNSVNSLGRLSSKTQGMAVGSTEAMPDPDRLNEGVVVQYLGATRTDYPFFKGDEYTNPNILIHGHMYRSAKRDEEYEWIDVSPIFFLDYGAQLMMGTDNDGHLKATDVTTTEASYLTGLRVEVPTETPKNPTGTGKVKTNLQTCLDSKINRAYVSAGSTREKVLSDNNFTDAQMDKLGNIERSAQVNVIETIFLNNIAQPPRVEEGVNTKRVYLTVMEGHRYPIEQLKPGVSVPIVHDLDTTVANIYSVQVRANDGTVLDCKLKVTDEAVYVTSKESETHANATLYLVVFG